MNSQNDWVQLNIVKNTSYHFWVPVAPYHFQPRDRGLLISAHLSLSKLPALYSPIRTSHYSQTHFLLPPTCCLSVLLLWCSFLGSSNAQSSQIAHPLPLLQGPVQVPSGENPSFKRLSLDFHGGPVVNIPRFHCRRHGFYPWSGNWDPVCHAVHP